MRRLASSAAVAALAILSLSAGGSAASSRPPTSVLGLTVAPEDLSKTLTDKRPAYTDHVTLYTLREPSKLLEGTLEIGHFKSGTTWTEEDFQISLVSQVGTAVPVVVRLEGTRVYLTNARGLTVAVWFTHNSIFVLTTRRTYEHPRELIRQALQVRP